jgi:hypothetical protein
MHPAVENSAFDRATLPSLGSRTRFAYLWRILRRLNLENTAR